MRSATFGVAMVLLGTLGPAFAEEKNGLLVTVGKKTLDRNDTRTSSYYTYANRIDRTQGLKVTVKNVSFKPMPAGEVRWTIVVRQHTGGQPEGYLGKETLKELKPAETAELVIGAAEVRGWNDGGMQAKDKIEHQVIILHGGKETLRVESTPSFEALVKQSVFLTPTQKGRPAAP